MYISSENVLMLKNNFRGREQSMIFELDGITISIEPDLKNFRYRVTVDIPKEAMKEHIAIQKGKDFQLEFKQLSPFGNNRIKLNFYRKYQRNNQGRFIVGEYAIFDVKDNGLFEFYLKIRPKLYVPWQLTEQNKQNKKKENQPIPTVIIGGFRPSAPQQTNYKYNNIRKPWQGGKVTPK